MDPTAFTGGVSGNAPIPPSVDPAAGSSAAKATPQAIETGAFRVLLDQLEQKAQALGAQSESVNGPEQLAGAVGEARASLEDALSIGDRILDAYREAVQRGNAGSGGEGTHP